MVWNCNMTKRISTLILRYIYNKLKNILYKNSLKNNREDDRIKIIKNDTERVLYLYEV